ncbi:MAG: tryptophan--tRNA ligase, partial [Rhodobacteraceae bacterium]|nr:tryptophan--tRNA ligase [Paracoccaceae bacterium]
ILFNQSRVSAHAELAWIFNCVARMGWLGRMTQFKEKAGRNRENASVGLFSYPTLMAADILVYHASHVPVGDDQKQHLELARDIAIKFNNDYDVSYFPVIEPIIEGEARRIMSLRDGTRKMSKSDPSDQSRINLLDDRDTIIQKIRKAKTDPKPLPETSGELDQRPEARNLLRIYAALADQSLDSVLVEFAGQPFSRFKPRLAELTVEALAPVTATMEQLLGDPAEIDRILYKGAETARAIATPILAETYGIIGLGHPGS